METEVFYSHLTTSEPTSYALMDYPATYVPVRARRQKNFTFQDKRTMYASGERINFKRTRDKKLHQRRQKKALLTLDLLHKWFFTVHLAEIQRLEGEKGGSRVGVWRGPGVWGVQGLCEEPGFPEQVQGERGWWHWNIFYGDRWGSWSCSASRKNLILVYKHQEEGARKMEQGSVWRWSITRAREMAGTVKETQEHATWAWRTPSLCSDRAWEQIVQGGCGVSVSGGIPDPSGHNPVPCASGWPCLSREMEPDDPEWSLPTRPSAVVLWGGWGTRGLLGVHVGDQAVCASSGAVCEEQEGCEGI